MTQVAQVSELDSNALCSRVQQWLHRSIIDGLSIAAAGGGVIGGFERLIEAMVRQEVRVVVLADDASPRTVRSINIRVGELIRCAKVGLTKSELGALVGQPHRAAIGLLDVGSAHYALSQLQRWLDWGEESTSSQPPP